MFQDAFQKLELEDIATILDQIQKDLDVMFDPIETIILAWETPFYPNYKVLEIANHETLPSIRRFVVYTPNNWEILDYSNKPIYKLNKEVPIKLNRENICDYIRFFFSFVKGKHGKFNIVESVEDIKWRDDPPPQARKAISGMITPITLVPPPSGEDKSKFFAVVCMMFKNALFKSDVIVSENGSVTLTNEQLQVDDMPVIDETLGP